MPLQTMLLNIQAIFHILLWLNVCYYDYACDTLFFIYILLIICIVIIQMYFDEINTNISMYSIYLGCGMCNMCNNLIMHCMYLVLILNFCVRLRKSSSTVCNKY